MKQTKTNDQKRNEKVILLGTASSLVNTPWGQHDKYDYWACGSVISHQVSKEKKMDAVFEMHPREYWNNDNVKNIFADYLKVNPDVVVYMQNANNEIKNSVAYPIDEVKKMAGHEKLANYHTSTISYMVALAILQGYKQILMYGCHMSAEEEEYSNQRACCEAWLNFGLAKGVDYWLTPETDIMKSSYLYGYDQQKGVYLKLAGIAYGIDEALKEYDAALEKAKSNYWQQKGGSIMMKKVLRAVRD